MMRRRSEGPQLASTFAVGEEAEQSGNVFLRDVGKIAAPLDRAGTKFQPGSTVRVDVVVRTRTHRPLLSRAAPWMRSTSGWN